MTTLSRQSDYCESALTIPHSGINLPHAAWEKLAIMILKKSKIIEQAISELLTKKTPLDVLEVGFGWARGAYIQYVSARGPKRALVWPVLIGGTVAVSPKIRKNGENAAGFFNIPMLFA